MKWVIEIIDDEGQSLFVENIGNTLAEVKVLAEVMAREGVWHRNNKNAQHIYLPVRRIHLIQITQK